MLGRKLELRIVKDTKSTSTPVLTEDPTPDYVAIATRIGKDLFIGIGGLIVLTAVVGIGAHAAHSAIDASFNQ